MLRLVGIIGLLGLLGLPGLLVVVATGDVPPRAEPCFQSGVTWDHGEDNVAEFQINIPSASECQDSCLLHSTCTNFTWYSPASSTFSRICVLYAHVPAKTYQCWDCISGPKICQQTTTSHPTTATTTTPITTTTAPSTTTITPSTTTTAPSTTTTTPSTTTTAPTTTTYVPITTTTTIDPTTTTTITTPTTTTTTTTSPTTTTTTTTSTITTTSPTPTITTTSTTPTTTKTTSTTTTTTTPKTTATTTIPATTTTTTTTHPTTSNPDCNSDCRCTDFTYDDCHTPHPTASIHVQDAKECMDNCEVFAMENRCQFLIYQDTGVDENCLIMDDDIQHYLRGCTIKGQPLYQEGNELMQDCAACPECESSCISCYESPCFGYAQLECFLTAQPNKGSDQDSYMDCVDFCKEGSGSTYAIYDGKQSKKCHCYSRGDRECTSVAMQLEADQCIDTHRLLY